MRFRKSTCLALLLGLIASGCASTPKDGADKKSPAEMAQLYQELGTQALMRSDFPQAIQDLRKSIDVDSRNAIAHNHLGLAYYGLGQKDLAKKEILESLSIDPKYSDAYINLGKYYDDEGNSKLARANFEKALDNLEYKMRHRALTNLASLSLRQNNLDEARKFLYMALQSNPDYCMTHFLMGTVYSRDGNHRRAAEEFKKSVVSTCSSNIEGHYQLGLAHTRNKDFAKAKNEFKLLVEEYPQSTQAQGAAEQLRNLQ